MKMKALLIPVLAIVLAGAAFGQGQGRGGMRMMGGGNMVSNRSMLLQRTDVQEDLKLTDDQKSKLGEVQSGIRDKMREAFQAVGQGGDRSAMQKVMEKIMADVSKDIDKVLTPEQSKRLKEIAIQMSGPKAVTDKEIQKELALEKEQIAKLADLQEKQNKANQGIFEKMRNGELTPDDIRPMMEKYGKIMDDEINKILTDAQKKKLTEMGGKKFEKKDDQ